MITKAEAKRIRDRVEKDLNTLRKEVGINLASYKRRKYSWAKLDRMTSA